MVSLHDTATAFGVIAFLYFYLQTFFGVDE